MYLNLDRGDLKRDRQNINCSQTKFDDFTEEVKNAIRVVGKATFFENKGTDQENYNAIYPPK